MTESILIDRSQDRAMVYEQLLPQIEALISSEDDLIANLANVCAALKESLGFLWIGFYLVKNQQLVLGPFQGPIACTRIQKGRGVCGKSFEEGRTIIVSDVDSFPGHIACSSLSKSEIVVPVLLDGAVVAVLDIDSEQLDHFGVDDQHALEKLCSFICHHFSTS